MMIPRMDPLPVAELITPQPGTCENCGKVEEVKYYRFPTPHGNGAMAVDVKWCRGCSFMAAGYIVSTWGQWSEIKRPAPKKRTKKQ